LLSLAKDYAKELPQRRQSRPGARVSGNALRRARLDLAGVIHLQRMEVRGEVVRQDARVVQHRLHLGGAWNVPVTELRGSGPRRLLISDSGRPGLGAVADGLQGDRVLIADVFGTGENRFPVKWQMMLSTVGERPLGMLVGQILALAAWAAGRSRQPIHLTAHGQIVSFGALCAAALEPELFAGLQLDGLRDSLKRLIDLPLTYEEAAPLYCFGLLKAFDIPDLIAMTGDLPIEDPNRGPIK